ncbi:uncharacterized protein MONBRDRAFT_11989 [Monosiga brevicollis MX1]|uniref:Uncharacterized protein n=1 Tax=Monosiga brevicollis TaxID=81824 RepID=A9VAW2_MONBE|nr:uncharacterized protein MONBRDRAFT_11989 [Monosiga brevicollis MX1]EDQ85234.1 predicted protein [Monosiga brevicollis MX1]|eukprot:XP_001749855.1 hypothetical protein [Monosiga brevicollis MX1]
MAGRRRQTEAALVERAVARWQWRVAVARARREYAQISLALDGLEQAATSPTPRVATPPSAEAAPSDAASISPPPTMSGLDVASHQPNEHEDTADLSLLSLSTSSSAASSLSNTHTTAALYKPTSATTVDMPWARADLERLQQDLILDLRQLASRIHNRRALLQTTPFPA